MRGSEFTQRISPEDAFRRMQALLRMYNQNGRADRFWEALEEPRHERLPDLRYAGVAPVGIPRDIAQVIVARCTALEKGALLTIPAQSYDAPDVGDDQFQVHTLEKLREFLDQSEGVAKMNPALQGRADDAARAVQELLMG